MMNLTPEQKAVGKENYERVVGTTRREFLTGAVAAGLASGASIGALYFNYESIQGDPLRIGVIGGGDEGNVLIGAMNPDYVRVVALADIRPYNVNRSFEGDVSSANANRVRPGLVQTFGYADREEAEREIKVYKNGYEELLDDPDVEAVVIALPLFLHAEAAIKAMRKGKHVLTEKLMGHNVAQCKEMGRVAAETNKFLVTGHQRHYSILYDNAVDTIRRGLLGELHHIRALWHRGNMPGKDSWSQPLPNEKMQAELASFQGKLEAAKAKGDIDRIAAVERKVKDLTWRMMDGDPDLLPESKVIESGYPGGQELDHVVTPLEELIRWRLFNRTGGGLMAELGSHQLDAAGIFIAAAQEDGKKALPLTVSGMGGRSLFPHDREVDDHVYCMYEFPGTGFNQDPNKKIVVTYSSINGNGFGGYGEVVYGTDGTLILERESQVLLYKGSSTTTKVGVKTDAKKPDGSSAPTLDTTTSGDSFAAVNYGTDGPPSRGYREEIEHWAWCIRNSDPQETDTSMLPRCRPQIALGDAVIALTSNLAIAERKQIDFDPDWFEIDADATPDGSTIDTNADRYKV